MIIGFDASRAFTKNRTGTENYSYQLLIHLAKIDTQNHYLVYIRPGQEVPRGIWPSNFKFQILNFKFLWTQAGLAIQTFKDKLDILFVPAHTLPLFYRPGLKTVVTVHDLGAEYLPSTHQLKQRLYLNYMTHHQLKSATHLIAVSEATKDDLVKKVSIPPIKVSVIYEGFNKQLFHPVSGHKLHQTLKHYNLQPRTYHLFVGTIQPRKNLERLIKAYAIFLERGVTRKRAHDAAGRQTSQPSLTLAPASEARTDAGKLERQDPERKPNLVLAGSRGWLASEIYALPKKLGIEDKVKFLGYVPDENLPALYSGASAFLFPSLFEGFGLPILEAMACGCPVLTSNTSSLPEVAGKAAVLVNPYSVEEIAQGINRVKSLESRVKLITAGKEQVKKFSWEKCARETLQVIKDVAQK